MKKVIAQYLEQLKLSGITEIYTTSAIKKTKPASSIAFVDKNDLLNEKRVDYKDCLNCELGHTRTNFVYGEGNPDAICMVIGEGPGEQEDLLGRPFVGKSGQLLNKMLLAIQIQRQDVYIANIVKCRPPKNRNPEQSERLTCLPYLLEQIEIIQPRIFLFLGLVAAQTLMETNLPMHELRGRQFVFLDRPAWITYHPAALLRNESLKKPAWEDLQKFQKAYEAIQQEAIEAREKEEN